MISVIICSTDPERFAAVEKSYSQALAGTEWEMIRIPNAQSLAEGYNRGVATSRGDVLIFSHDDVEILASDFAGKITRRLETFDIIGVAGTTKLVYVAWVWAAHPYLFGQIASPLPDGKLRIHIWNAHKRVVENMQALDGVFLAARRSVFDRHRFDEETFDGFHLYDIDFTYSAYKAGLKLAVVNDLTMTHMSEGSFDAVWETYAERFQRKWMPNLKPDPFPLFCAAMVEVPNRQRAIEVMNPTYWDVP